MSNEAGGQAHTGPGANYMQVMPNIPKVFAAISAITGELAKVGIAKDRKNTQQGYSFRGIDQVYNVLAPLLAQHKLNILPQVVERGEKTVESKSGGKLNFVTLKVNYIFVSAEDASNVLVTTFGEGMDSADKATNKALSAAYKYAVIQAFAIPVEGTPDADEETPTEAVAPEQPQAPAPEPVKVQLSAENHDALQAEMKAAKMSIAKTLKYFGAKSLYDLNTEQMTTLQGFIDAKKKEQQGAVTGQG